MKPAWGREGSVYYGIKNRPESAGDYYAEYQAQQLRGLKQNSKQNRNTRDCHVSALWESEPIKEKNLRTFFIRNIVRLDKDNEMTSTGKRMPGAPPPTPPPSETQEEVQDAMAPKSKKRKVLKPRARKAVPIETSSEDSSSSEDSAHDTDPVEEEPEFEEKKVVRRKLQKIHCFCHLDYVTINSKAGKTYIKCGKQEYPCNMFSTAGAEYDEQVMALNKEYPSGFHFSSDWPERGHYLKAAVRKGGKDGGYFWACKLGRRDADLQCDFTQNFKAKSKKPVTKRCLVQKKIKAVAPLKK